MPPSLPSLEIRSPTGLCSRFDLTHDQVTIGRFAEFNDLALDPDPQLLVTRKVHCRVQRDEGGWWVVDNGSVNKTFVRRWGELQIVDGRWSLADEDVICILGQLSDTEAPLYWELTFKDPFGTRRVVDIRGVPHLQYDWLTARTYLVRGSSREEVRDLRLQEHKLIRYMDQRNRANGGAAVMCTYEEIIFAVWGEDAHQTESDVNHLVWALRQKIELDPARPGFLQTVRGMGYRLETTQSTLKSN